MKHNFRLYDTLTQETKPLSPQDGIRFRFYCCGPTVYGPAHIGNFRTFVLQDVFRRVAQMAGLNPLHVRNITDVDDKTIRQSQAENKSLKDFTDHWTEVFEKDCLKLGLLPPHASPSAVGHIQEQIAIIKKLIEKGHAYVATDGVYFNVASFSDYGALAHLDLSSLQTQATNSAGTANQADEYDRERISDFALWKKHKPEDGPNSWDSPWGQGRPGWHIECSAMCQAHLGHTIDLHGGGIDLIFPHHVNEIAQSEGATGKPFCQHWFHVAHLKVEGEKMSKSLGNLYTLDDLEKKGFSPSIVRYLLLSGHYRQPLNFTFEGLHAAKKALERLETLVLKLLNEAEETPLDWEKRLEKENHQVEGVFTPAWQALLEDLNTPQALGALFATIKDFEKATLSATVAKETLTSLAGIGYALGLYLNLEKTAAIAPDTILTMAQKRWEAKKTRDFQMADQLRKEIEAAGWKVLDHSEGYEVEPL